MGLGEGQILKRDQVHLNPLITVILGTEHRKRDGLGARQEGFELRKGCQRLECHDGFHPPIMPETQPRFRLISCWKDAPQSDSFHIGRDCLFSSNGFSAIIGQANTRSSTDERYMPDQTNATSLMKGREGSSGCGRPFRNFSP
jgi:hypothetical protein